jgi:asparagine synthetase B (glutamine-hydrolysing)
MKYRGPAFNLPIIQRTWTLDGLDKVLTEGIIASAIECIKHNRGIIFAALSGGLDSSFCLAVLRHHLGDNFPIFTFTVGTMKRHPDVQYAEKVAEALKTNHQSILVDEIAISVVAHMKDSHPDLFWGEIGKIAGGGPTLLLRTVKKCADAFQTPINEPRLIVHDGIDELLGGYWDHRKRQTPAKQETEFKTLWSKLHDNHLFPLWKKAEFFGVVPLFPYLQPAVIDYISRIPVNERTSHDESKIPLRRLAEKYLPPEIVGEIIQRPKIGFCDALKEF